MRRGETLLVLTLVTAALSLIPSSPARAGAEARADAAADTVAAALSQRLFPVFASAVGPAVRSELGSLLAARFARRAACGADPVCTARAMLWSEAEAAVLVAAGARTVAKDRGRVPAEGIAAGLSREVAGLNTIIRVYALGEAPSYPAIDGPGIPVDSVEAQLRLRAALAIAQTPRRGSLQTLDPSIEFALALLDVNERTDAISFEPLAGGLNAGPFARAGWLDWKRYRYTAMVIPGSGPEVPDVPLSPLGKLHVRLAADRFTQGDVPFIIVSGGRAHPRATPFNEAVEMRRALIERHGIPADAIVIEPYARHTTTNMRNAARLLLMMGAPLNKDMLVVANPTQSANIESALFAERNRKELGYEPGKAGRRLSPTELEYRPAASSARVDPHDPLDP